MLARLFLIDLLGNETGPLGDVRYYLAGVYGDNPRDMTEYPQVGTWPSILLAWITGDDYEAYAIGLSLIHISEPTRPVCSSRMPSSA